MIKVGFVVMEIVDPMLFSFWMVVAYIIFSVCIIAIWILCMIAIWICVGMLGGPCIRLKRPRTPKPPKTLDS